MSLTKEQLLPGENLIALAHQHPVVLTKMILLNIVSAAVLIALSFTQQWWFIFFDLAPLACLLWKLLVRQRREFIITDRRVVRQ